jgi:hypothetical protein
MWPILLFLTFAVLDYVFVGNTFYGLIAGIVLVFLGFGLLCILNDITEQKLDEKEE